MPRFILRLDDACEKRDIKKWNHMEALLDQYGIKPLVGIIPYCQDKDMAQYSFDDNFWDLVCSWQKKDWILALHGYTHVFCSSSGGLNPVNHYSEFAGVPLEQQKEKIKNGISILQNHGIYPKVFFAPAHTYDENTLIALKECSRIRIISDTIANDIYRGRGDFTYIPQQSGKVRKLPFRTVTFCYHPNNMKDGDFELLESFLKKYSSFFSSVPLEPCGRKLGLYDRLLRKIYFARR